MATVIHRASTPNTANQTSYVSDAFTPAVGDVLVVFASLSGSVGSGSASGSGITFTQVATAQKASGSDILFCFVSNTAVTSATSQTVTVTVSGGAATGATIFVASVAGLSLTGASAVRQSAVNSNVPAANTMTAPFGQAILTSNPVLAFIGLARNPAAMTPPSGFTELADTGYATPTQGAEYAAVNSGVTASTLTWGNAHAGSSGCIAVEIDAFSGTAYAVTAAGTGTTGGSAAISAANLPVTNLVTNPSFEVNTSTWSSNSVGGGILDATHGAVSGTKALQILSVANSGPGYVESQSASRIPVTANNAYTVSAYAYKEATGNANPVVLSMAWFSSGGTLTLATGTIASVTATDTWARMSATVTSPPGAAFCIITVQQTNNVDEYFWVDAVMLTDGVNLFDYFDGSTPGDGTYTYSWSGTPHASQSVRMLSAGSTTYSLTASGAGASTGSVALARTTSFTATGAGASTGSVAFTRTTSFTATGTGTSTGSTSFTVQTTVTASGAGATGGSVTLTRQTTLTASGAAASGGNVALLLQTNAGLSAAGVGHTAGSAALIWTATLTATGTGRAAGSAAFTLATALSASGAGQAAGAAAFTVTAALSASGAGVSDGLAVLAVDAALTATGIGVVDGRIVWAVETTLTATGTGTVSGLAQLRMLSPVAASLARTLVVPFEHRVVLVPAESRTLTV